MAINMGKVTVIQWWDLAAKTRVCRFPPIFPVQATSVGPDDRWRYDAVRSGRP